MGITITNTSSKNIVEYKFEKRWWNFFLYFKTILCLGVCFFCPLLFFIIGGMEQYKEVILTLLGFAFASLLWIPFFVIHKNYYNKSKNNNIRIDYINKLIYVLREDGMKEKYNFSDIKSVFKIDPTMKQSKFSWSEYGYYLIIFKSETQILITSVMSNYDNISFDNSVVINKYYPYISNL